MIDMSSIEVMTLFGNSNVKIEPLEVLFYGYVRRTNGKDLI